MLYPKQEEIVQNLTATFKEPYQIAQKHLFISGEMGVGKTYMASSLINRLEAKKVLIACPTTVAKKWQKVAQEYNPTLSIAVFDRQVVPDSDVTIVCQRDLFKFFKLQISDKTVANYLDNLHKDISNGVNRTSDCYIDINDDTDYTCVANQFKNKYDLAIFDEIHLYQPTHQDFTPLAILSALSNQKILGLTGTIFNQNLSKLAMMLTYTNHELIDDLLDHTGFDAYDLDTLNGYLKSPYDFYQNIWRYIGAQIGLNQVKERQSVKQATAKQETMPLNGIDLNVEQAAWQELAQAQLEHLHVGKNQQDKLITSYIDLPTQKQITLTRSKRIANSDKASKRTINDIGIALTPIKLEQTKKFKQLAKVLHENPVKTLIYVQDKRLLAPLAENLSKTSYLPEDVKRENIEDYLKKLFTDYDRVVVTSKRVNVGIDIREAQNVIWYQVPMDVATIIQANRRVLRLGDKTASKVWYLFYKNTAQEKTIEEVSHAAVNNAAAYSTRLDDNLARVTKVLFGNIDSSDEN